MIIPSISVQDYLQTIYRLQTEGILVSTSGLAAHLGLAPASVTEMVQKLHRQGLVDHTPYRGVALTGTGEREALRLLRRHRLWELFLTQVLGLPWDEVHEEAHRLEHATSDRLADRLAEFLEQPQVDPHGQRIPSPDGILPYKTSRPLTDIVAGQRVRVIEVPDGDPALLRFLAACGLQPGAELRTENPPQLDGPLVVQIGGAPCVLQRQAARRILVTEVDPLPGGDTESQHRMEAPGA